MRLISVVSEAGEKRQAFATSAALAARRSAALPTVAKLKVMAVMRSATTALEQMIANWFGQSNPNLNEGRLEVAALGCVSDMSRRT